MSGHAILSASKASLWTRCAAAISLIKDMPDSSSVAACEGTAAHELGERALLANTSPSAFIGETAKGKDKDWPITQEMADYVSQYTDYINNIRDTADGFLYEAVEVVVDFSDWVWYSEDHKGFGTADHLCVYEEGDDVVLHVTDLKYGKGVEVDAFENLQGLLYALGGYIETQWQLDKDITLVRIAIVQPRIKASPDVYQLSIDELLNKWAPFFAEKAAAVRSDNPEFNPSIEACRWCPARNNCKARAKAKLKIAQLEFAEALDIGEDIVESDMSKKDADKTAKAVVENLSPDLMTPEQIAYLFPLMPALIKWAEDIKKYALKLALSGKELKSLKLVAGRSTRVFKDEQEAENRLLKKGGYERDDLYEEKMLSLAKLEKLLGKKEFDGLLGDLVDSKDGTPTLVLSSDKRQEIKPNGSAKSDFDEALDDEEI